MKLQLEYDCKIESPCEYGAWKMVSFNRRHGNFQHPDDFFPANIGLRRKLKTGTAFILSCYEHGGIQWGLRGETRQCRWDTTQVAGIIFHREPAKYLPKRYVERSEIARSFINVYNEWVNGEVFYYSIENDDEELIDSCGGFIGSNWFIENLKNEYSELFAENAEVEVTGNAKYLWDYV